MSAFEWTFADGAAFAIQCYTEVLGRFDVVPLSAALRGSRSLHSLKLN